MIDGKWQIKVISPFGEMNPVFEFICGERGRLKGTCYETPALDNPIPIKRGKFDGNDFSFGFMMGTPMGAMDCNVSGSVEGDAITGAIKVIMGSTPFDGVRIKD
ncbi:MAG: hypothetical protein ACOX04_04800 [Candidatus Scatomorpha sp.]|jgi:hypothetical protein